MSTPQSDPSLSPRYVSGKLYAFLFFVTVVGYIVLVVTGHSEDTGSFLSLCGPILGGIFLADRLTGVQRQEGANTRHAIKNGTLAEGLVNALKHPEVREGVGGIVREVLIADGVTALDRRGK